MNEHLLERVECCHLTQSFWMENIKIIHINIILFLPLALFYLLLSCVFPSLLSSLSHSPSYYSLRPTHTPSSPLLLSPFLTSFPSVLSSPLSKLPHFPFILLPSDPHPSLPSS